MEGDLKTRRQQVILNRGNSYYTLTRVKYDDYPTFFGKLCMSCIKK